jgi:hypothetical protein
MSLQRTAFTRLLAAVLCALAGGAIAAPDAGAAPARYEGTSTDGGVVVFSTAEALVNGDADGRRDVLERSFDSVVGEYVTRLVSLGPIGGNQAHDANFAAISGDGSRVFFSTAERLVPADGDSSVDLYLRDLEENTTTLISQGASICSGSCGNGAQTASFVGGGLAAGGNRVFFATAEKLSDADGDAVSDVYMRDVEAGATVLVSRGDPACAGCGDGGRPAFFADASVDGTKAVLISDEGLVSGDVDSEDDLYRRDLGLDQTVLISVPGNCPGTLDCSPVFGGVSDDGSHVFFETKDQIQGADTDESSDLYDWSGGTPALASTGPDGGNGAFHVTFAGNSGDGESAFFHTDEKLVQPDDEDSLQDVYERQEGSVTALVSKGPQSGVASSATLRAVAGAGSALRAFFITGESLVSLDTDGQQDAYERSAGETTLVSRGGTDCEGSGCGNGPEDANLADASDDGLHALFVTDEQLVETDTDSYQDIYERSGGQTILVSAGPVGGSGPFPTKKVGISGDGSKVYFETSERLTVNDDFLEEDDVYGRSEAGTLLESIGNDPNLEIGPPAPKLQSTNPASPGESTTPKILGQSAVSTDIKIYKTANCSGEQALDPSGEPAGGSSEELVTTGIQVVVPAGSTTTFYATAEAEGFISPCSTGISYTQQAAEPPPPPPGGGSGGGDDGKGGGSKKGRPKFHSGGIPFVTPETRITFGPAFKTRRRKVVFRFFDATGQPGTRFICRIDRRRWGSCDSPKRLRRLGRGRHTFRVKAVNAAGTWEDGQTRRRFKVVGR